jgi:phytoene dehydrogenase-like protein
MRRIDLPKADAIVVGAGPNGLAAAIRLAQAGRRVVVVESAATPGGGVRSAELTLPGFVHDVCSSVYPMTVCSPFLRGLPLHAHGLEWIFPPVAMAHPLADGSAVLLHNSLAETAASLGAADGAAYRQLIGDLVPHWQELFAAVLAPPRLPRLRHSSLMFRFGLRALSSARGLARRAFNGERARALFAGLAAHSLLPLEELSTSAVALVLCVAAHATGWPIVRGGAQQLTSAMVSYLKSLGGQIVTECNVESLDQLPPARAVLLDVTPRQLLRMAGDSANAHSGWRRYRQRLERYRYGVGSFKIDWALSRPVPWRSPECALAGTLHLGGTLDEICDSERRPWLGQVSERPFVLFAQPSLFDSRRAPATKHTAWGYCHVPHAFAGDLTDAVEKQVERFAPGFRATILARSVMGPAALERHNANLVGGDIAGGAPILSQLFLRPTARLYGTPLPGVFLCSSSTPPGPGVHGMCGYWAAEAVLKGSN